MLNVPILVVANWSMGGGGWGLCSLVWKLVVVCVVYCTHKPVWCVGM